MQATWMMTPNGLQMAKQNGCDPRELLGLLPSFLLKNDPRPANEQIDERYCSGWRTMAGFTFEPADMTLRYPGDPPMKAIAFSKLRDEMIIFFEGEWLAIVQADGRFEVNRVD